LQVVQVQTVNKARTALKDQWDQQEHQEKPDQTVRPESQEREAQTVNPERREKMANRARKVHKVRPTSFAFLL
jgi:hypothetical protein